MKLKVLVLKKKQLIWAGIIFLLIVISAILLIRLGSRETVNTNSSTMTFSDIDIDNDGKPDSIVIKPDDKTMEYNVDIITSNGETLLLESDPSIKTLGYYSEHWPINVVVKDLNKDGIKELVIQSSDEKGPILHIFKYSNEKMERISSGRYSFFGTIKMPKDKENIIMLGAKRDDTLTLSYLQSKNGKFYPYTPTTSLTMGKDALNDLITFIEKKEVEAFNVNIDSKMASVLSKGIFLDGIIEDVKFSSKNIPTECIYTLRTASRNEETLTPITYKLKLSLTKYDNTNPEYRVSNIQVAK